MNKYKVRDFVGAYSRALKIDNDTEIILLELMEKIITKYERIVPNIPVTYDQSKTYLIKPQNGYYTVEDFFLNRLMRNIWKVDVITNEKIKQGFASIHTKGQFLPSESALELNPAKMENQVKAFEKVLGKNYQDMKKCALKKVIMHEFEHGLQTRYDDQLDMRYRQYYKNISDELRKTQLSKYNVDIQYYEELPKSLSDIITYIATGVYYNKRLPSASSGTYRKLDEVDYLNEILNETESLEMSSQKSYLSRQIGHEGNMYSMRNPESSNCDITNYGDMFKLIIGSKNAFELMYLDCHKVYENFNKLYTPIFQKAYGSNKDAVELFILAIAKIKKECLEQDHLKLNEVLAKCFELKVTNAFSKDNITNEKMLQVLSEYEKYIVKNGDSTKNSQLAHVKILNELRSRINSRAMSSSSQKESEGELKRDNSQIFRRQLDKSILENIKQKIYNYLKTNNLSNASEVLNRMNSLTGLYVENLVERNKGRMVSRGKNNEIAVDVQFVQFDKDNNPIGLDPNLSQLIESQLGHELLHTGSRANGKNGVMYSHNEERGLNEGFTQLITENIFGYTVSNNSDNYDYLKKFAKILEATFGKQCILEAFFGNSLELQNKMNAISPNYYANFNRYLTSTYFAKKDSSRMYDLISKDMILNVVIPAMKNKTPEEANNYIKNIALYCVDNFQYANDFLSYLDEYSKMDSVKLQEKKAFIARDLNKENSRLEFYYACEMTSNIKDIIKVTEAGEVLANYKNNTFLVINSDKLDMIYAKYYEQVLVGNKDKLSEIDKKIMDKLNNKDYSIRFSPKVTGDVVFKKAFFAYFKKIASNNGINIANDINSIGDVEVIDLKVSKIEKDNKIDFNSLKSLLDKYDLVYPDTNNLHRFEIRDKNTNRLIDDDKIKNQTFFAYLWLSSFGTKWLVGEKHRGETYAFSEFSEGIYNEMYNVIQESLKTTGTINVENLCAKLEKGRNFSDVHNAMSTMFKNPISTNMVYQYFAQSIPKNERKLETEQTKYYNFDKIDYKGYLEQRINSIIPSNNKYLYEELYDELAREEMKPLDKDMKPQINNDDYYRLFVAVSDGVANAISVENDVLIAEAFNKLEDVKNKITRVNVKGLDFDKATIDEKIQYCLARMKRSLERKDIDSYNLYRDKYNSVVNGITNGLGKTG